MLTPLALVLPLLVARPVQSPESIRAWSEDALFLVEELERRHPDPWFGCPREDFDQAMDTFLTGLEGWDEPHATAEFLRLFARLSWQGREGHATVWPISSNALPVQLYGFVDGWYVVAADEPALVGARVQAVAGVPIDELCARLAPLLTRDNDWNLRAKLPMALTNAELLAGVGLALPPQGIALTLVREGRSEERVLVPSAEARGFWHHSPLPARAGTHWLEGTDQAFRLEVLAPERTLYVQYNEVSSRDRAGRTLADFVQEMVRTFEEHGLARLVLDVRSNGGGDNTTFRPLIEALKRAPLAQHGTVFALIGRHTFSAAGNFVTTLERETKAILVGEPTGGAPNQYGDARAVELPHHRELLVHFPTRYHVFGRPDDPRLTHEPHVAVPLRAEDYFAGRDPVLAAALTYVPPK